MIRRRSFLLATAAAFSGVGVLTGSDLRKIARQAPTALDIPVGYVQQVHYKGVTRFVIRVPDGWLPCDGSEVSRIHYSGLFAVIGDRFGDSSGPGTFKLPDLRNRSLIHPLKLQPIPYRRTPKGLT